MFQLQIVCNPKANKKVCNVTIVIYNIKLDSDESYS